MRLAEIPRDQFFDHVGIYVSHFPHVPWVKVQNFQNPQLKKLKTLKKPAIFLQNNNISSLNSQLSLDILKIG